MKNKSWTEIVDTSEIKVNTCTYAKYTNIFHAYTLYLCPVQILYFYHAWHSCREDAKCSIFKSPFFSLTHMKLHMCETSFGLLTHFEPMFHFYTPWLNEKTGGFRMFSEGVEVEHWLKMG